MTIAYSSGAVRADQGTQRCYCNAFLPGLHGADEVSCSVCGANYQREGAEW